MSLGRVWLDFSNHAGPWYRKLKAIDIAYTPLSPLWAAAGRRAPRRSWTLVALILFLLSYLFFFQSEPLHRRKATTSRNTIESSAGLFHLIIPSRETDVNFCRTTLSAQLVGYPVARVINWDNRYEEEKFQHTSYEWAHFNATLRYLQDLPDGRNEDLMLIASAADTWFQLNPEVLIKRYRAIVTDAQKRARDKQGGRTKGKSWEHSIVFAAQKVCAGKGKDDVSCYAVPRSPLTPGTYEYTPLANKSSRTDSEAWGIVDSRPKYLNTGAIMGTVGALKHLYLVALSRWIEQPEAYYSQQQLFSELFGEQEYEREMRRSQPAGIWQRLWHSVAVEESFVNFFPVPQSIQKNPLKSWEFGITLDYTGAMAQVLDYAERDGDWIRFSDFNTLSEAAIKLEVAQIVSRTIAQDIEYSRPPYWSLAPSTLDELFQLPRDIAWESLSLWTNLYTATTPALLIYPPASSDSQEKDNSNNEDRFNPRDAQWNQMWYQPYARTKLDITPYEPTYPIASEQLIVLTSRNSSSPAHDKTKTTQIRWWPALQHSPTDKYRSGFGFVLDDRSGRLDTYNLSELEQEHSARFLASSQWQNGDWKRWSEVCSEDIQTSVLGNAGGGVWKEKMPWPPYDDDFDDD